MGNPIEISGRLAGRLQLLPALPSLYETQNASGIRRLEAKGSYGHLLLQEMSGEGYTVWHHHYLMYQDDSFIFTWEQPVIRLWLSLKNSFYFSLDGGNEAALHERGFNIEYAPFLKQEVRLRGKQTYSCIEFHFSPAFFAQWAAHFPTVDNFLHRVKMQHPARLGDRNGIAGREMLALIEDVLYCTYTAAIRRRYLAHKVMEGLFLSLQQLSQSPAGRPVRLAETVVSRIYQAGELLTENLNRKYTLQELGDIIGLSPYSLKKGFKGIYSLTATDFQHEARMQKARLLLEETDLSIPRIAADTGYNHPFAFSSAFRKYFGYPPSLVRKGRRIRTD